MNDISKTHASDELLNYVIADTCDCESTSKWAWQSYETRLIAFSVEQSAICSARHWKRSVAAESLTNLFIFLE